MTLDEFVLAFRSLSRGNNLALSLRGYARHLYICLALDLPSAVKARKMLLSEAQHSQIKHCGPNVSPLFEAKLKAKLKTIPQPSPPSEKALSDLVTLVLDLVNEFIEAGNPCYNIRDPFCLCACNELNRSFPDENQVFCRYMDLASFEKHILFPGRCGKLPVTLQTRREFYSEARIRKLTSDPHLFELGRNNIISLGRPPATFKGHKVHSVVFMVPEDGAPHKTCSNASEIASLLGLPLHLQSDNTDARENEGFAVLRLKPDSLDFLFRPTILDALDHLPFRPGPADNGSGKVFRYGWTRVFKSGELLTDEASIADQLGCKEVVMPSRPERFPSAALELETVCFFE